MLFETHLQQRDVIFIAAGIFLLASSAFSFLKNKTHLSLLLLFLGALVLSILMTIIDPFLNVWDEEFHALVALHLKNNLFAPALYEKTYIPLSPFNWTACTTWIHKPPLFLWQMAATIKIFGANVFAVRIPSAILSAFTIPAIYRIGKLGFSEKAGYLGALFLALSNIQLEVITGRVNTDHNDVIFMCYVTFSIWAWTEFYFSGKKKFIFLIGIFAGAAVLVKWLPGMIVFAAWGLSLIIDKTKRRDIHQWSYLFISTLLSVIIFLPWIIYNHVHWPELSRFCDQQFVAHITTVLEGHDGTWLYHFSELQNEYGWIAWLFIPAFLFVLFSNQIKKSFRLGFSIMIFLFYAFYLFVKTKMPLLTFPMSPLLMISIAALFVFIFEKIKFQNIRLKKLFAAILIFFFCIQLLSISKIDRFHTSRDKYWAGHVYNNKQLIKAAKLLEEKNYVVFNCANMNHIVLMFYTGEVAYPNLPEQETISNLKIKNIPIAVFDDGHLPGYISTNAEILKLDILIDY